VTRTTHDTPRQVHSERGRRNVFASPMSAEDAKNQATLDPHPRNTRMAIARTSGGAPTEHLAPVQIRMALAQQIMTQLQESLTDKCYKLCVAKPSSSRKFPVGRHQRSPNGPACIQGYVQLGPANKHA
jgi:hypothetical protein